MSGFLVWSFGVALPLLAGGDCSCPPEATSEPEACGEDLNGGCNSTPAVFGSISGGEVISGTAWADDGERDTDWYVLDLEPDCTSTIVADLESEFDGIVFVVVDFDACVPVVIGELGNSSPGCVATHPAVGNAVGSAAIFVAFGNPDGSMVFDGFPCDSGQNGYCMSVQVTACEPCAGDTNADGVVDVSDLSAIILAWGPCQGCPEDLDGDGDVGVPDLTEVILSWGVCSG